MIEQHCNASTSTATSEPPGARTAPVCGVPFRMLLVVNAQSSFQSFELSEGVTHVLGRAEPADILLDDPSISRRHASLCRKGESVRLIDLSSRNGCWVSGLRVTEAVLRVGSGLVLGGVCMSVQVAPSFSAATFGLIERASLHTRLDEACARSTSARRPLAVLMVRALTPSTIGLRELVSRTASLLRAADGVALFEPGVLCVVLSDTSLPEAEAFAQRLAAAVAGAAELGCGVARMDEQHPNAELLLSAARRAVLASSSARCLVVASAPTGSAGGTTEVAALDAQVRKSSQMLELGRLVERLASRRISVLVTGETGSGKELIARELHERGERREGPFKVVNCGAIPKHLIESELFGHVRGAFTGALRDHPGVFAQAHNGTIFLDEVGELSAEAQTALLRVLDTQRICPIGDTQDQAVDVRVVTATHRDLREMVECGSFRLDLYHRLNAVVLQVPPLRERPDEIAPLAEYFVKRLCAPERMLPRLSKGALACLHAYPWPGNIRELRNVIERALALTDGTLIQPEDLPSQVQSAGPRNNVPSVPESAPAAAALPAPSSSREWIDLRESLKLHEAELIREALRRTAGNQRRAARLLRLPLRTLERKLKLLTMTTRLDLGA
jgi:two-component system response regulator AtoC